MMEIDLTAASEAPLAVHVVRDGIGLAIDDRMVWLTPAEARSLRHQLLLAVREADMNAAAGLRS